MIISSRLSCDEQRVYQKHNENATQLDLLFVAKFILHWSVSSLKRNILTNRLQSSHLSIESVDSDGHVHGLELEFEFEANEVRRTRNESDLNSPTIGM